jgi:hypothetical protein
MDIPGYEPFYQLPDAERLYRTERGSTYAHFKDQTSQRNRSGEGHADKTTGMQKRSVKTVYMNPQALNAVGTWFQNPDVATRFDPVLDKDGKQTGKAQVKLLEPYTYQPTKLENGKFVKVGGPVTIPAGRVLAEVPYDKNPAKGLHPVEIYRSQSPKGTKGEGVHFGSRITEVMQRSGGGRGSGGGGGMMPDVDKVLGKNPLNMAKGGFVEKAIPNAGNWKLI